MSVLGKLGGKRVHYIHRQLLNHRPSMLVTACFHGNEPAGAYGILKFLETIDVKFFDQINLTFIPVVNPTGFELGTRWNRWGENPNVGFCHKGKLSKEGQLLLHVLPWMQDRFADGLLSLHEDWNESRYYVYTYETTGRPGSWSKALVKTGREHFPLMRDGWLYDATLKSGVIYRHCDGAFEDLLYHLGVPRIAVTETPGKFPLGTRAACGAYLIDTAARYVIEVS